MINYLINRDSGYLNSLKRNPPETITQKVDAVPTRSGIVKFLRETQHFVETRPSFWEPYWDKVYSDFVYYQKSERPVVHSLAQRVGYSYVHSSSAPYAINLMSNIEKTRNALARLYGPRINIGV